MNIQMTISQQSIKVEHSVYNTSECYFVDRRDSSVLFFSGRHIIDKSVKHTNLIKNATSDDSKNIMMEAL